MYGFCTRMTRAGSRPFSSSSARVSRTFSPVFVERFSVRMRSAGTPIATATRANWSASGSVQYRFVIAPRPPENTSRGAQPSSQSSAARGDRDVETAQHQDDVGGRQRMLESMVVPDLLRERADAIVHPWIRYRS